RARRRLAGGLAPVGGPGLPLPHGRLRHPGLRQLWRPEVWAGISAEFCLALPERPAPGVPAGGPLPAAIVPVFLIKFSVFGCYQNQEIGQKDELHLLSKRGNYDAPPLPPGR